MKSLDSSSKKSMEADFKEVFQMFKDDLASELGESPKKEASLAHSDSGVHAIKTSVIEKTEKFAEAMKSLDSSSQESLQADFKEVLKMFKDDVESGLEESDAEQDEKETEASLAHSDSGLLAVKTSVIEKTKKFAEAMKSLDSSSKKSMEADFKEVFQMFKDDLEHELPEDADEKEDNEESEDEESEDAAMPQDEDEKEEE